MGLILRLITSALAVFITAYILPGIYLKGFFEAVIVAVVLGVINIIIKPFLLLLTLPINILTLGLFTFVINAGLILLASNLVEGFRVDGFWWAVAFSLVLSLVASFLHSLA